MAGGAEKPFFPHTDSNQIVQQLESLLISVQHHRATFWSGERDVPYCVVGGVPHARISVSAGGAVGPSFMFVESIELGSPGAEVFPNIVVGGSSNLRVVSGPVGKRHVLKGRDSVVLDYGHRVSDWDQPLIRVGFPYSLRDSYELKFVA